MRASPFLAVAPLIAAPIRAIPPMALATVLLASLSGCHMDQRYVSPEGGTTWQLGLASDTPPFFTNEDLTVYMVEQRIELPLRAPTDEQRSALDTADERGLGPYPRRPWAERGDYQIEIELTVSNLTDARQRVAVTLNGWNEFHEYQPGVNVVGDDVAIDFAGWERTYDLAAGERRSVTVREEEIDEIAVDLATVVNGAPNSNQITFFQNHSDHDVRAQMYIPPIVPALLGVRLGLRVESADEPPEVPVDPPVGIAAIEAIVRVRDLEDRIVGDGEESWDAPQPAPFLPVVPME